MSLPMMRLLGSPLGVLVRAVARVRASVHVKLLAGFLLITVLFIAMTAVSLLAVAETSRQTDLLDQAHERVGWSRQIEHALAMQMHFTSMALLSQGPESVSLILRENNRFNDTLARLETAAPAEERTLIQAIRGAQEEAMATVADIANAIRDGRLDDARASLLGREDRVYREIEALVGRLVEAENTRMASLRDSVEVTNRQSLVVAAGFAVAAIALALLCGFVISWSFILPVREADAFLARVTAGQLGATITVPNRDELGALGRRRLGGLLLAGAFLAVHFASWIPSVGLTTVAASTVLVTSQPVWAAAGARLVFGERVRRAAMVGIAVALAGAVLISGADFVLSARAFAGDLLALLGAVAGAGYLLAGRRLRQGRKAAHPKG